MGLCWEPIWTIFRLWKCGSMVPLGQALASLIIRICSLPGLQEMLDILWSPRVTSPLLASAWNGGAHHSSLRVSARAVKARPLASLPCLTEACALWVVEQPLRPGEAGDTMYLHFFFDAFKGSNLISGSSDITGWDRWTQGTEKSLGECHASFPKRHYCHQ